MRRYRFERREELALAASAWGLEFDAAPPSPILQEGAVAVVGVSGPLTRHDDWFCDSYDAIKERVRAALASPAAKVVMRIDSPGGDAQGCCDTSREIRAMATAAGKPLIAWIDGMGCSAAYALACAADTICAPAEALLGSIGVIKMSVDQTAMDRQMGLAYEVFSSGARKADGNPHTPLTDEARASIQGTVDGLAQLFFELVSERRGLSVEQVRGFNGATFYGQKAVDVKLADRVATFSETLAMLAEKDFGGGTAKEDRVDYKEMVKALRALAEGTDKDQADKAKAALKAMGEDGEEPAKDKPKEEPAKEKAAEDKPKEEPAPESDKKPEASARASSDPMTVALAKEFHDFKASVAAKEEREERDRLLASRPDFSAEVSAVLRAAPMGTLRDAVKTWPRGPVKNPAAEAQVQATRGEGQGDGSAGQSTPEAQRELDARMGLSRPKAAIRREGKAMVFGAMTSDEAAAHVKQANGAKA